MRRKILHGLIPAALFFIVQLCHAQNDSIGSRKMTVFSQAGFQAGVSFYYEFLPEGTYKPMLLQGNLDFQLKNRYELPPSIHRFYLYVEPFINPVIIPPYTVSIELGTVLGVKYGWYFKKINSLKVHVGTGPQFLQFQTEEQAKGFIFSNNFGFMYQRDLKRKPVYLTLGYRFRHISNLYLIQPNAGIDIHFILFGIGKVR